MKRGPDFTEQQTSKRQRLEVPAANDAPKACSPCEIVYDPLNSTSGQLFSDSNNGHVEMEWLRAGSPGARDISRTVLVRSGAGTVMYVGDHGVAKIAGPITVTDASWSQRVASVQSIVATALSGTTLATVHRLVVRGIAEYAVPYEWRMADIVAAVTALYNEPRTDDNLLDVFDVSVVDMIVRAARLNLLLNQSSYAALFLGDRAWQFGTHAHGLSIAWKPIPVVEKLLKSDSNIAICRACGASLATRPSRECTMCNRLVCLDCCGLACGHGPWDGMSGICRACYSYKCVWCGVANLPRDRMYIQSTAIDGESTNLCDVCQKETRSLSVGESLE